MAAVRPALLPLLAATGVFVLLAAAMLLGRPAFAQNDETSRAPSNLTVALVNNAVTLTWDAPAEDADSVTGYEILRRRPKEGERTLLTLVDDTGASQTSYVDYTANEAGVKYTYRVIALRGEVKSRWSNYKAVTLPDDFTPTPEAPPSNTPATGTPAIMGTPQPGETLTADTSGIADADGLSNVSFSYRWISNGENARRASADATSATYTPEDSDVDKTITVEVTFTDDAGNPETLSSVGVVVQEAKSTAMTGGICGRTQAVQEAILAMLPDSSECSDVTNENLSSIDGKLYVQKQTIESVKDGDFAGLSNLFALSLHNNNLTTLPVDVFDGLASLRWLYLSENGLETLPTGVFSELHSLTALFLNATSLTTLPEGVFDGLDELGGLYLGHSNLRELPDGLFDGLENLTALYLSHNDLSSLPDGVFEGLANLNNLHLHSNPGAPFTITAELETAGNSTVVVKVAEGAPLDMELTLSADGGALSRNTVTVDAGDAASEPVAITHEGAGPVTITIESVALPEGNYQGFNISAGDPLAVKPLWSATLTVGEDSIGDYGYNSVFATPPAGALSSTTFSVDGVDYTVNMLAVQHGAWMHIGLDKELPMDFRLHLDGAQFSSSEASFTEYSYAKVYLWNDEQLNWAAGDTMEVSLSRWDGTTEQIQVEEPQGVCDRTRWVRDSIVHFVLYVDSCELITQEHLANIGPRFVIQNPALYLRFKEGDLDGLVNVTQMRLRVFQLLGPLPSDFFRDMGNLEVLVLAHSLTEAYPPNFFDPLVNLRELSIFDNRITEFPPGSFANLSNLQTLLIYETELANLQPDTFSGLVNLENLDLRDNRIRTLPPGVFARCPTCVHSDWMTTRLSNCRWGVLTTIRS